jgi:hypothetical protein
MTEDHIFPKSIAIPQQRQVTEILKHIKNTNGKPHSRLFQNGLFKKTLCSDCNNRLLGSILDPALEDICRKISNQLRNVRFLMAPNILASDVQLNKISRAVAGHFLAASDTAQWRHPLSRSLRRYVMNFDLAFPEQYRFQLWLYPFKQQALLKDLYHTVFGSGYDPFGISAYKTFPLAFSFSDPVLNPAYKLDGILDVSSFLNGRLDRKANIQLRAGVTVDPNWPYAPHKNGVILSSDNGSVQTKPYMKIKPYPY